MCTNLPEARVQVTQEGEDPHSRQRLWQLILRFKFFRVALLSLFSSILMGDFVFHTLALSKPSTCPWAKENIDYSYEYINIALLVLL